MGCYFSLQGIFPTQGSNLSPCIGKWLLYHGTARETLNNIQFSSVTQSSPILCDPMNCSMPGLPVHHQLPEFTQTHVHRVSDAIQPSHPLSSPKVLQLQHQSFQWIFKVDWFPLGLTGLISLQSEGTLSSLLQHHSSKVSVLWCSAFFMVQLSYLYMTNGKTIALTRWTIVNKVTSLLLNTLSRLVIAFLPRRVFLILWLQSPSTVILEPKKIKSITASTFSLSICHEVMGMRTPWTCLFENNKIIIFKRGLMLESV